MSERIVVYEDFGWQRLLPLVYLRATAELVCGMDDLLGKVARLAQQARFRRAPGSETKTTRRFPSVQLWCRPALAELCAERTGLAVNEVSVTGTLLLNGRGWWRSLPESESGEASWVGVVGESSDVACIWADRRLAAELSPEILLDEARSRALLAGLPRRDVSQHVRLFNWPWEIVLANEEAIRRDWTLRRAGRGEVHGRIDRGAYLLNPLEIHVGAESRIKPCVVIDAEDGPVWVGRRVTILPHSYVQGPAYLGDGTLLQPGSVVHAGTTIGPRSKVGGEIEASIVHGFSNKQHDGFLGHSYVGSWVNIAADCINSDLKNTYGTVRVPINGREVDTGEMFVGMLVGDYSKAGINVSFPTGAVIGFCSSVFAPRSPKFVPSFAWIDGDRVDRYDEQRGVALARKVMARRSCTMSAAEERAFLGVRRLALAIEHQPQVRIETGEANSIVADAARRRSIKTPATG